MLRAEAVLRSASGRAYAIGIAAALSLWGAETLAGPTALRSAIADVGFTGFGVGACAMLLRAIRRSLPAERAPWAWLFAGTLSWLLGQISLNLYELGWIRASVPALSDVMFLAAAPLFVVGCVAFLARGGERLAILALALDVGTVMLTLLAGVAFFLRVIFVTDFVYEPAATVIALLYPVLYVAATGAALSTLFGLPPDEARGGHISLVVGIGLNGLAFTLWLPRLLSGTFSVGTMLDPIWMVGVLAVGVAGSQWVEDRASQASGGLPAEAIDLARLFLPGVLAALAASFLIASQLDRPSPTDPLVAIAVGGTMILLATRAGLALYANHRLAELQRRRAARYQALYEVGLEISEKHSVDELLRLVVDRAIELTRCDGASLSLADGNGGYVNRAVHLAGDGQPSSLGDSPRGIALAAIQARDLVAAPIYEEHPRHSARQAGVIASAIASPLIERGEVIGGLVTYSRTRREFSPDVRRLFRLYAAQAAIAIANARMLEATEHLASDDALTAVRNRRSLMERLELEVSEARRHGDTFCVVMCDLDGLKQVNDTAGHLVGDQVLRSVAEGLRASSRTEDVVARFGGDEFVLLLPRTTLLHGQALVARLAGRLRERTYQWGGRQLPLPRISIGVAAFPDDGLTADALIAAADARMYVDKTRARDLAAAAGA